LVRQAKTKLTTEARDTEKTKETKIKNSTQMTLIYLINADLKTSDQNRFFLINSSLRVFSALSATFAVRFDFGFPLCSFVSSVVSFGF